MEAVFVDAALGEGAAGPGEAVAQGVAGEDEFAGLAGWDRQDGTDLGDGLFEAVGSVVVGGGAGVVVGEGVGVGGDEVGPVGIALGVVGRVCRWRWWGRLGGQCSNIQTGSDKKRRRTIVVAYGGRVSLDLDPRPAVNRGLIGVESDWDVIRTWTDDKYMRFDAHPIGRGIAPASSMFSVPIGEITMTRFSYGVGVDLANFDADSGNVLVLTTLRGWTHHAAGTRFGAELTVGQTYVADCSRVDYSLVADPDHLQLNLTIPHRLLADLALRWWGYVPDDRLWTHRCVVGGPDSAWLALLGYAARTAAVAPDQVASGRIGANLQEMIAAHLLDEWAQRAGIDLSRAPMVAAPGYVRSAVRYIDEHARDLPTVTDVAAVAGVSVRGLGGGFSRYLGMSPRAYLVEQRLQGVYRELSAGAPSVAVVARSWGYVNMSVFAAAYRRRFGENPSATLARGSSG
ncbi:AraC family transcriptional regulator [Gordonia sp. NPDC003376]